MTSGIIRIMDLIDVQIMQRKMIRQFTNNGGLTEKCLQLAGWITL